MNPVHVAKCLSDILLGKVCDKQIEKTHLDICRNCPESTKNSQDKLTTVSICMECYCLIHLKVKTLDPTCKCPLNKW